MKSMQDFEQLIEKCREKSIEYGEIYIALEVVLNMMLKSGVSAKEITHIRLKDVVDEFGNINESYESPLLKETIDLSPVRELLETYVRKLQQWNEETSRQTPYLFPVFFDYQNIQYHMNKMDPTFKINDVKELAKTFGHRPRRGKRKKSQYSIEYEAFIQGIFEQYSQLLRIEDEEEKKGKAQMLLNAVQSLTKNDPDEDLKELEQKIKEIC